MKTKSLIFDILKITFICFISFCFSFGLISIHSILDFDNNENSNDYVGVRKNYFHGISYGSINLYEKFDGELIGNDTCFECDKNIDLTISLYDEVIKEQLIGLLDNSPVYSSFHGIVTNIERGESIKIFYRDFDKYKCTFEIDSVYKEYLTIGNEYLVLLKDNGFYLPILNIEEHGNSFLVETDFFTYEQYEKKPNVSMRIDISKKTNILRIENKYLTNKISDSEYVLNLYNPYLEKNNFHQITITTGIQNDTYTEILSNNVFPYEEVVV